MQYCHVTHDIFDHLHGVAWDSIILDNGSNWVTPDGIHSMGDIVAHYDSRVEFHDVCCLSAPLVIDWFLLLPEGRYNTCDTWSGIVWYKEDKWATRQAGIVMTIN